MRQCARKKGIMGLTVSTIDVLPKMQQHAASWFVHVRCAHKRILTSLLLCVFEDSGLGYMAWNGFLHHTRCNWLLCVCLGGRVCAALKCIKVCISETTERVSVKSILLFSSRVAITEWEHNRFVCWYNRPPAEECVGALYVIVHTAHVGWWREHAITFVHMPPDTYELEQEKARGKQQLVNVEWNFPPFLQRHSVSSSVCTKH